MNKDIWAISW